jgi:hypothetical protein
MATTPMKAKNESFYILGYLLELNIKYGEIGSFYEEKSFSMDQNHTFQVEIWQNFAPKKKKTKPSLIHICCGQSVFFNQFL